MTTFSQLRDNLHSTYSLLNYTISKCEIFASDNNIKEFNHIVDDTEMLLKNVQQHINELKFLSKLQRLTAGSKLVKSNITNSWFLMKTETIVETDFAISKDLIDALVAKYKFIFTGDRNQFFMYELINKTI
jgi:hypothetical protein